MTDPQFDLDHLNDWLASKVKAETAVNPEVVESGIDLDKSQVAIEARRWIRLEDAVVVFADLRNSTQIAEGRKWGSVGAIYEASIGGLVEILYRFGADHVQIQGDGAYGIFWGDRRYERGVCAGITIVTFSKNTLVPVLTKKFLGLPETGFKVGVASGDLLVKRVGKAKQTGWQEPVWAGNAVNYAAKCAQQIDASLMLVTASVWSWVEGNDYLSVTCPCENGPSATIWKTQHIEHLRPDDDEAEGRRLTSQWCAIHGAEFCAAVMAGLTQRSDVGMTLARRQLELDLRKDAFEWATRQKKRSAAAWRRGLRRRG